MKFHPDPSFSFKGFIGLFLLSFCLGRAGVIEINGEIAKVFSLGGGIGAFIFACLTAKENKATEDGYYRGAWWYFFLILSVSLLFSSFFFWRH